MKTKIFVPICNRTNYSKLKPILAILKHEKSIDISAILSSGMVVPAVNDSFKDIIADHVDVSYSIDCLLKNDSLESMTKTAGLSIIEHASIYARDKPDALLVVGDRFDMLSAVLAARMMNIPIFHIQGGEVSGSIDDKVRNIISICSEKHYVATDAAALRVNKLTNSDNIFNFGCPAVELISEIDIGLFLDCKKLHKKFRHNFNIEPHEKYFLVIVHPDTTNENDIDMQVVLNAVLSFGVKAIVLYPNIDAFSDKIEFVIRDFKDKFICFKHMPIEDFITTMGHSACLIGNSSSGIREAASFGIPVVNIGNRQNGRERNSNTIDCQCDYNEIINAIDKSVKIGKYNKHNIYYKKNCANNICNDIIKFLKVN